MTAFKDRTGQKFGRLTVVRRRKLYKNTSNSYSYCE